MHYATVLRNLSATRIVVTAYLFLALTPFAVAATHHRFWTTATAPITTVLFAALLAALVARRRWAWLLLTLFEAGVLISFAIDFTRLWAFLIVALGFALLISPAMRGYVRGRAENMQPAR